jgi:integral membrane sensor domain MASE1
MAAVQGDPRGMQSLHGWLTLLWLAFAVPVLLTDLKNSVPLLVFISIYANVAGHWSSWQASRVEVRQEEAGQ